MGKAQSDLYHRDMTADSSNLDTYHVESDPDLFRVRDWAADTAKSRVIQTRVGAYGALDQKSGTTYFDVGDYLVKDYGQVIVLSATDARRFIEEYE